MLSMLWKVGAEGNALNGGQAPLLCDVTLEMPPSSTSCAEHIKQIQNG